MNKKIDEIFCYLKTSFKENIHLNVLTTSIIIYSIVFSKHLIIKHHGFATFAWDLGIFNQSYYTTAFNRKIFFSTAELYQNPTGSYFGSKFSPILFLLLPFYMLLPRAETLLVLKTFILALAAYPLYLLALNMSKDRTTSLFVSLSYLLYPGLHGANNFDFQQQLFIPLILFSLAYALNTNKRRLSILLIVLSLTITEHVAIITTLLLGYQLLYKWIKERDKLNTFDRNILLSGIILAPISFFVSKYIREMYPVNQEFIDIYRASSTFEILEFKQDIIYLPLFFLQNIDKVINSLSFDFFFKLLYLIFLFTPLIYIPFKSRFILGVLILATPFLISNYRPYYSLGSHYSLYLIPFIFLAFLEGLTNRKISETTVKQNEFIKLIREYAKLVLIVSLFFTATLSPLSPISGEIKKSYPVLWYADKYQNEGYVKGLHTLIDLIPPESSILVQNNIFPHVSNRYNAYVLPVINNPEIEEYLKTYIQKQINESEYVLLDFEAYDIWKEFLKKSLIESQDFNPYGLTRSSILFKRNYYDAPIFTPEKDKQVFFSSKDLYTNLGKIIPDKSSENGHSFYSPMQNKSGAIIYGPYIAITPGNYEAVFRVKVSEFNDSEIMVLDVCDEGGNIILTRHPVYSSSVILDEWINITIPFYIDRLRTQLEFRIFTRGFADIYCDKITVKQTEFTEIILYPEEDLNIEQGLIIGENETEVGFVLYAEKSKTNGTLLSGPYIALPPGYYTANYWLKIQDNTTDLITAIDICTHNGKKIIAKDLIYGDEFTPSEWGQYQIDFQSYSTFDRYEFRVITTGYVDLYCKKIVIKATD